VGALLRSSSVKPSTTILICLLSVLACACSPARNDAFFPYQATVEFWVASPDDPQFYSTVARVARDFNFIESDDVRTTFVIEPGFERLMAFSEPPPVAGSLLFIEREPAKGKLWIRVVRWCLSSCQLEVDKVGMAMRIAIEEQAGNGA